MSLRTPVALLAATTALLAVTLQTPSAQACGGFFCNAQTQSPIFQSGERIMFVQRDNGIVSMHIEVSYQGSPTEFGWLIPILGEPRDAAGNPVPLDQAIQLSSSNLFQTLQQTTDPSWTLNTMGEAFPSKCDPSTFESSGGGGGGGFGCPAIMVSSTTDMASFGGAMNTAGPQMFEGNRPDPYVLDTAAVGPYDAELITAPKSSDDLFDWLNANGYVQDPASKPLLGYYVSQGYKFIGVRLQNGKSTGDIRPILLNLPEGGPCVPLRLTGIAATDDMPMRIWVLGNGRAIPKNFLHAVINEQAVDYPNGGNYDQVVADAVAEAGGRAFVTEMSDRTTTLQWQFISGADLPTERELWAMVHFDRDDFERVWDDYRLPRTGQDYTTVMAETLPDKNRKMRLIREVALPALAIERAFRATTHITRFYTRIDADDMTRDPVFSFNKELPMVEQNRTLTLRSYVDTQCSNWQIAEWEDGRRFTLDWSMFGNPTLSLPDAPPLLRVEVADEQGQNFVVHEDEILDMDAVMDRSILGQPTLTDWERSQFRTAPEISDDDMWPNKPADFDAPMPSSSGGDDDDEGCQASGGDVMTLYMLTVMGFLIYWRRRLQVEG